MVKELSHIKGDNLDILSLSTINNINTTINKLQNLIIPSTSPNLHVINNMHSNKPEHYDINKKYTIIIQKYKNLKYYFYNLINIFNHYNCHFF